MKFIGYIRKQDAEEGGGTLISQTLAEDVADQYVAIYTPSEAGESSNTTTQDEWRDINTAPKDGSEILARWATGSGTGWVHGVISWSLQGGDWQENYEDVSEPDGWMPFPSPPAAGSEL